MFKIIKMLLNVIRIIVPIMLIILLMIDFTEATLDGNSDSIKKASTLAVTKSLAAVLIFFIPNFVHIVVNTISGDDTYEKCLSATINEEINVEYF